MIIQSDVAVGRTGYRSRRAADKLSLFKADNRPDARNHRANAGEADTGTRVLAPFRLSVANMLGNLVMQASTFEVTGLTPVAAPSQQ